MWIPSDIETKEGVLDFTSSGQERRKTKQLVIDGTLVANAIDLTSWEADSFQTLVCSECGIENCEPGNWMTAKSAGDFAVLLPAFEAMLRNEASRATFGPPHYLRTKGCLLFNKRAFSRLREYVPRLPQFDELKSLRGFEIQRMLQLEAPHNMLGKPGDVIALRTNHAVASSVGEVGEQLDVVDKMLRRLADRRPMRLRRLNGSAQLVVISLADAKSTQWTPLAIENGQHLLHFVPGIVVQPD